MKNSPLKKVDKSGEIPTGGRKFAKSFTAFFFHPSFN